jgi:exonuclease VII small subunit
MISLRRVFGRIDTNQPNLLVMRLCFHFLGSLEQVAMSKEHIAEAETRISILLYQLREDLAEIIGGLESGRLTLDQVVTGTTAELEQILKVLSATDGAGPDRLGTR